MNGRPLKTGVPYFYDIDALAGEELPAVKVRIVVLCTPDYEAGREGVAALRQYAARHGYEFRLYEKQLLQDLHINFTKMEIMRRELKQTDVDYTVLSDADIEVLRPDIRLESIINASRTRVVSMPQDAIRAEEHYNYWTLKEQASGFNAGFIIGKNGAPAVKIMQEWIKAARTECAAEAEMHPRNQRVFDKCVVPRYSDQVSVVPYMLAGVPSSAVFRHFFATAGGTAAKPDPKTAGGTPRKTLHELKGELPQKTIIGLVLVLSVFFLVLFVGLHRLYQIKEARKRKQT